MKLLLLSVAWLAAAGVAVAQPPMSGAPSPQSIYVMPSSNVQVPPPGVDVRSQAPVMAEGCSPAGCCPTGSCAPAAACVRQPSTRTITHVNYCKQGEEFCVPSCCCLSALFGGDKCGDIHVKYYLVKKVRTETCPTTKCVPAVAPGCGTAGVP